MEGPTVAIVLCTGADPILLKTRKLILEKAGHTVVSARDREMVIAACKDRAIEVAIIGQSLSLESKRSIAACIRQFCPSAKLLELHAAHQSKAIADADAWLEVPAGVPQELAERVSELAQSAGKGPQPSQNAKAFRGRQNMS
jgi:hypothetical protein